MQVLLRCGNYKALRRMASALIAAPKSSVSVLEEAKKNLFKTSLDPVVYLVAVGAFVVLLLATYLSTSLT